jgi:hypothetical protein
MYFHNTHTSFTKLKYLIFKNEGSKSVEYSLPFISWTRLAGITSDPITILLSSQLDKHTTISLDGISKQTVQTSSDLSGATIIYHCEY